MCLPRAPVLFLAGKLHTLSSSFGVLALGMTNLAIPLISETSDRQLHFISTCRYLWVPQLRSSQPGTSLTVSPSCRHLHLPIYMIILLKYLLTSDTPVRSNCQDLPCFTFLPQFCPWKIDWMHQPVLLFLAYLRGS